MEGARTQADAIIVGAGPTGLIAANLLGQAGISTLLLERNAGLSNEPRAITLDNEGLRICQASGLRESILPDILSGLEAYYLAGSHILARVSPGKQPDSYPLISTFHQPTFEATLLHGLARFPCVQVLFQHTIETFEQHKRDIAITARTDDDTLLHAQCSYLLACDGAKSTIRHMLDISLLPVKWSTIFSFFNPGTEGHLSYSLRRSRPHDQRWLVIDAVDNHSETDPIVFFCNPARPAVTVPAPYGLRRWEFMLLPGEDAEALLNTEKLHALISSTRRSQSESSLAERMLHIQRRAVYTFHATIASDFAKGRIFLLGDAAHQMPPFGGQGMNSGLRDAYNLCWKLRMVLQGRANPPLLATYHQERYPHAARMILFSTLLGNLIMPTNRLLAFLRNLFFYGLGIIPPLRTMITEARIKPQPIYRQGLRIPPHGRISKHLRKLVGLMLPQPLIKQSDESLTLLDDVLGNGFALIRLYDDPATAFTSIEGKIWKKLDMHFVCVLPAGSDWQHQKSYEATEWKKPMPTSSCDTVDNMPDLKIITVMDSEKHIASFLRHNHDVYLLVRPDRSIAGIFPVDMAKHFGNDENMLYYFGDA